MIYFVKGEVFRILKDSMVIENSAGVGYEIICNNKILSQIKEGDNIRIITYTHIIQDDIKLFGFLNERELNLFKMLITVNGVGCRVAQSILEVEPNIFINAVINDDAKSLTKIKGIGLKTAQRIIVELKNTIKSIYMEDDNQVGVSENKIDAKYALLALGYNVRNIDSVMECVNQTANTDEIIKEALVLLNN